MSLLIERSALYQEVAERLRRMIYDQVLLPGQPIDETKICEQLGISRTPLREALKVLHSEGLVEHKPRRGSFVKTLEVDEMRELFPVMAVLEGLCAREAVARATRSDLEHLDELHEQLESYAAAGEVNAYYDVNFEIHQFIQEMSGNRWLQRVTSDLRKILRLARHRQLKIEGRLRKSLQEHRKIMKGFHQRDPEALERTVKQHLVSQLQALEACETEGKNQKLADARTNSRQPADRTTPQRAPARTHRTKSAKAKKRRRNRTR